MTTRPVRGFSLIEMAVVLFIVVLLLGSLLVPFATQVEQRRINETQKTLEEIREALIGFAASHRATNQAPYLPCPDVNNDGLEDREPNGLCAKRQGLLPWATLGTAATDPWGNRFQYAVSPAFSRADTGFDLNAQGDLTVCEGAKPGGATDCAAKVAEHVPAVVLSYGKNGYGATRATGSVNPAPGSPDEIENTNADAFFVARVTTPAPAPAGEFDDIVTWLSPYVLFDRMVAAQRLP